MQRTFLLDPVAAAAGLALAAAVARGDPIAVREARCRTTLRATAFAEKAEAIVNPVEWGQVRNIAGDGCFVRKGERIAEFDGAEISNRLEQLRLRRGIIDAELERKLTELRNREMGLRDDVDALEDEKRVHEATLARMEAEPDEDEVRLLAGKVRLAEAEQQAAERDLARARGRHERGMISAAQFESFEFGLRESGAALQAARLNLEYVSQPAPTSAVRKAVLQIENARMGIEKLRHELDENARIAEIERHGARARREIIDGEIREREEELRNSRLHAPVSGYVMHTREFREEFLKSGAKLWKHFTFMRIYDPATLAFKGVLPEADRRNFSEGDTVRLTVTGRFGGGAPGAPGAVEGTVASFSVLPRDRSDREERDWGAPEKSGVKVYDLIIRVADRPAWLRVGMHAEGEVVSARLLTGPAVPAALVRRHRGEPHLSIDGVYRKVSGTLADGWFVLDDAALAGRDARADGRFEDESCPAEPRGGANGGAFRASGELLPANTADVVIRRIRGWQKVTWLIPEDTQVAEGEVVARLDDKETLDEITEWESRLKEAESAREALEKKLALQRREGDFQLARERNVLEISRIDWDLARTGRRWREIFAAELAFERAGIRLARLRREFARLDARDPATVSPLERDRLRRDSARQELETEAAGIRLAALRRGPARVEVRKAELDHQEQKVKLRNLEKKLETDLFRLTRELAKARSEETRQRTRLAERREWLANLTLRAPRAGMVQYNKVWNSGVFSKVNIGTSMGDRFAPMTVADVSEMYIRTEIPERYFRDVREGLGVAVDVPSLSASALTGTVTQVEFLFEDKRRKDTGRGLYSAHETLGETVFYARVDVPEQQGVRLKPGAVATVRFPFQQ